MKHQLHQSASPSRSAAHDTVKTGTGLSFPAGQLKSLQAAEDPLKKKPGQKKDDPSQLAAEKKKPGQKKDDPSQLAAAEKKKPGQKKDDPSQLAAAEKKKPGQKKDDPSQLAPEKKKPGQMKEDTSQLAAEKKKPGQKKDDPSHSVIQGKIPDDVRAPMEQTLKADFSDVNIHVGSKASAVGALAYTQGNDIHFAQGKFNPDTTSGKQLLGHELTHVVQQRQGRVQPTTSINGLPVNDNPSLEREADVMGNKAASAIK
jgi:hypothetical protein